MAALIATYPPVGQVTRLQEPTVRFRAVLEINPPLLDEPWQLALWHSSGDGQEWTETELLPCPQALLPFELREPGETAARLYFAADVPLQSSLNFTAKYRQGPGRAWRWVRDELGLDDGVVVLDHRPAPEDDPDDLPDLIKDLNPDLRWKSHMSQSPGTRLWSIEARVDAAKEGESTYADPPLGIPWGRFVRWFALVRSRPCWLAPRQGQSSFVLDEPALLCSFLSHAGKHLVFLGISGVNDVTTVFNNDDSGRLMLHIRSDNVLSTTATVLVALGDELESAIAAVMYHARSLVMAANGAADERMAEAAEHGDVRPEWYKKWYDGLGYCTWNSLGQRLTEKKVLKALDALAENDIHISSLIIDDNWQNIDYRGNSQWQHGWNDFEAEPKAFPGGLKSLVSNIRAKHKNIEHIAVWHTLLGYWAGLAPNGPLAKRYQTIEVTRTDSEPDWLPIDSKMTVVAAEDVPRFYNDFYRFLSSCGIDGVKTDAQYMIDTLTRPLDRRDLITAYQDAWTVASLKHFSGRVISCMSQSPSILFHSQLPHNRPQIVLRNSDDYYPPEISSYPWHVFVNAHNALLTQHLNILPDWDMFQSRLPDPAAPTGGSSTSASTWPAFHAAARCLSGGPVYITDVPGCHDLALLRQITATAVPSSNYDDDGGANRKQKVVILRPSRAGRALGAYAAYNGGDVPVLLKIGAYHGRAEQGTGMIGVFNLAVGDRRVVELLPLGLFPGVIKGAGKKYVVRSHVSGRITPPAEAGAAAGGEPVVMVSLPGRGGYDVLSAYPVTVVESGTRGEVRLANMGLVGKMTGCAAVVSTVWKVLENGRMLVDATLKALGVLGVYISVLPELSIGDDFMVTILGQPIPSHTVSVNKDDKHILDVDVETAWKEMGLKSGWANEVQVKVYFALEKRGSGGQVAGEAASPLG